MDFGHRKRLHVLSWPGWDGSLQVRSERHLQVEQWTSCALAAAGVLIRFQTRRVVMSLDPGMFFGNCPG